MVRVRLSMTGDQLCLQTHCLYCAKATSICATIMRTTRTRLPMVSLTVLAVRGFALTGHLEPRLDMLRHCMDALRL
jgi:hypothetical protein